jgi:hypothetical protein
MKAALPPGAARGSRRDAAAHVTSHAFTLGVA